MKEFGNTGRLDSLGTKSLVLVALLVMGSHGAVAERLPEESMHYLGYFLPPSSQGGGEEGTWDYGMRGMTLIPDCMGQPDPSPGDGYPGCIGAFGHEIGFQFGVFDIVPAGEQANQVIPFYELGAPIAEDQSGRNEINYWDVFYDKGPSHCRLWWTYHKWYITNHDDPFLGVSSCVPGAPDPIGMFDFGEEGLPEQEDPLHSAKMHQGLSLIPQATADRLFDGKRMMVGISRRDGTLGGSQGPSLYVRPMELPTVSPPGPVMDATPLVWYLNNGYVQWYAEVQMDGPVVHWWSKARAKGAEFLRLSGAEAVVLPWSEPTINPEDYPCSDPLAYRDEDPTTPEPCEVPVCWYGMSQCASGEPDHQQPSFWEDTSTGEPMPVDCNVTDGSDFTGVHCLSQREFLILYDVDELAAVYRGEESHHFPQPYAKIPLADYQVSDIVGSTYDEGRQLLFLSEGGRSPAVHVFSIAGPVEVFVDGFESGDTGSWSLAVP